jgi:ABC-type amino acid transport substrate-binding protein
VNAGLAALKAGKLDAFVYDRPILQLKSAKISGTTFKC